jgi:hypothetical protein
VFDSALALGVRSVNKTFLVTEELTLDERFRDALQLIATNGPAFRELRW